jgi:ATP/maltotriose-dependent transcriptional regulator MalT
LSTGHASASERAFAVHDVPRIVHRWGLVAAISRGDRDRIAVHSAGLAPTRANALSTILLAWAGASDQADLMAGRRQESITPGANARQVEALWAVADGERHLLRGETTQARPLLERAHTDLDGAAYPETFIAIRSLARLRLETGDTEGARQLLRRAVAARTAAFESSVPFWLACAQDLIALERRGGDLPGADRLEQQNRTLLGHAESAFEPTRLGAFRPHHP